MRVTMLGSGTSTGVPRVDGDWGACDPTDPRNRRRRPSVLVEHGDERVLVDTGPDCREQLLAVGGGAPTAVFWTHEHADHCHGIDDLRAFFFRRRQPIQGWAAPRTHRDLHARFGFAFAGRGGYIPYLTCELLPPELRIGDLRVRTVELPHGGSMTSTGLRFDTGDTSFVYYTDCHALPDAAADLATGVDLWIVDCVRHRPHPTHSHVKQTLEWVERVRPKRTVLTHMDQSMDYVTLAAQLPAGVEPGYDGLAITL